MKPLEQTCVDCPSREIMPDIAALMQYVSKHFPEIAKQITADGMSPMFAAVVAMRTQAQRIKEIELELELETAINNKGNTTNERA